MIGSLHYANPERIHMLWLVFVLVGVLAWLELRRRDAVARFVSPVMLRRLADRASAQRRALRLALVAVSLTAGVFALMRPQTRGEAQAASGGRVSADIVVALDVSRSMLAEDAAPTRLARAKAEIADLVSALDGHRIGLVAFAGRAVALCPLTTDYGFFRTILRGVDTDSVSRGGTRIGDALRAAVDQLGSGGTSKLVLLITDGEDHDSYPRDAAKEAHERGIRVVTIGFGSEEGSPITLVDPDTGARTVLTDKDGQVVQSRLDGALLRDIALTTEGAYVPAGVAAVDLESIVDAHIEPMIRDDASEQAVRIVPGEQYPWFVIVALLALIAATWLGTLPRGRAA